MPLDGQGKYQLNNQKVRHADAMHAAPMAKAPGETAGQGAPEHPEIHAALTAMHAQHGGQHMHVHTHEGGVMTHHTNEHGQVEGPHHHGSMDEAVEHMKSVMGGETEAPIKPGEDEGSGDNDSWD